RTTTRDVRRNRRAAKKAAAERLAGAGADHSAAAGNRASTSAFMAKKNTAEQAGATGQDGSATQGGAAGRGAVAQDAAAQGGAAGRYGAVADWDSRMGAGAGSAASADGLTEGTAAGYRGAGAQAAGPNGQVATDGRMPDPGEADDGGIVSISGLAGTPHAQIVGGWRRYHGNDQVDGTYEVPGATAGGSVDAGVVATEVPNQSVPVGGAASGIAGTAFGSAGANEAGRTGAAGSAAGMGAAGAGAANGPAGAASGFGVTAAGASSADGSNATDSAARVGSTEGDAAGFGVPESDATSSRRARIAHRRERAEETAGKGTIAGSKSFSPKASITNLGEWLRYQGERFVEFWRRHPKGMVAVVAVVVALVMVYGPARDYYVAWRRQSALQATYDAVSSDNDALQGDVDRLQSREGIEDEARRHGYGYSGESTIDVEGLPDDSANQGSNPIDGEVQAQETDQPWYIRLGDVVFGYSPDSAG
ncbi:MAG: hypothetical protein PUD09_00310, partial [Coriobacteriales bacterium]|nr:hypothetical protein [Coriobacteriales bacterium]